MNGITMIKGNKKQEFLKIEDILFATNGGYDIFQYYLGKVEKQMSRPWGKTEKKMSWGVFPRGGVWFWKDQATEEGGSAIQFVEKYFGLTMQEAKDKICWDFGLKTGKEVNANPVKITWEKPEVVDKEYIPISFTTRPFSKREHEFWNLAEVTEEHCNKYNCFAVKDLAINRKKKWIGKDEIVFVFWCPEEDGAKIYFPEREKDQKFRNNVSYHHLWNYGKLENCDNLIVQKSVKDMIVTAVLTECVTATQAEAVKIFDTNTVEAINKISKTPWIWYGSDWDGVKKCKEITDTNGWKYINTPKALLPEVNDVYSFVRYHNFRNPGTGMKELEKFMKSKKLIL